MNLTVQKLYIYIYTTALDNVIANSICRFRITSSALFSDQVCINIFIFIPLFVFPAHYSTIQEFKFWIIAFFQDFDYISHPIAVFTSFITCDFIYNWMKENSNRGELRCHYYKMGIIFVICQWSYPSLKCHIHQDACISNQTTYYND